MRGILVDQVQASGTFGNDVGCASLPQNAQGWQAARLHWRFGSLGEAVGWIAVKGVFRQRMPPTDSGAREIFAWAATRRSPTVDISRSFRCHVQCRAHGALHSTKYRLLVAEAHFGFGRMHIDINKVGRHTQHQRRQRKSARPQQTIVSLHHSVRQSAVLHGASIDEEDDAVAAGSMKPGQRRIAAHADCHATHARGLGRLHRQHVLEFFEAKDARHDIGQLPAAR